MRQPKTSRAELYERKTFKQLKRALSYHLLKLREVQGLTQEDAAHQCDMPTRVWQQLEAEEANATLVTLARLCDGLGTSVGELFSPPPRGKRRS